MIERVALVAAIRQCVGIPYRHQGRTRAGLDCIGCILYVAWQFGVTVPDDPTYTRTGDLALLTHACQTYFLPKALNEVAPGDILQLRDRRSPCHLAWMSDQGHPHSLVHALPLWGKVVEHGYVRPWPSLVLAAYQLPGDLSPWPA